MLFMTFNHFAKGKGGEEGMEGLKREDGGKETGTEERMEGLKGVTVNGTERRKEVGKNQSKGEGSNEEGMEGWKREGGRKGDRQRGKNTRPERSDGERQGETER